MAHLSLCPTCCLCFPLADPHQEPEDKESADCVQCSHSVGPRAAAPASPGSLLEMLVPGSHPNLLSQKLFLKALQVTRLALHV